MATHFSILPGESPGQRSLAGDSPRGLQRVRHCGAPPRHAIFQRSSGGCRQEVSVLTTPSWLKYSEAKVGSRERKWKEPPIFVTPRTLGRKQTEGIVFSCELLSQVTYFFFPYPSHSPNSGHKKVVVNFACLLWVKFIECQNSQNVLSGFSPFSVMDP